MSALHSKSMLVKLTISQFSNQRVDPDATAAAITLYVNPKSTITPKVMKNLLPVSAMSAVTTAESSLRGYHRGMTLPWEDGGWRLLPSAKYMEYTQGINERKRAFANATSAIIDNYDHWKNLAKIASELYREEDYPSRENLVEMFHVELTFQPLPNVADFRLDAMDKESQELRVKMQAELESRLANSVVSHLLKLGIALSQAYRRLSDPQARFQRSTIDNLKLAAELGHSIDQNLPDDKRTDYFARTLDVLGDHAVDDLRHDLALRHQTAIFLKGILDDICRSHPQADPPVAANADNAELDDALERTA